MAGFWGNAAYRRLPHYRPSHMAEIGVDRGQSSGWLLARCPDLYLYMIDPWIPYTDSNQPDARRNESACENARKMAYSMTEFADHRRRVLRHDSVKATKLKEEDGTPIIADASLDVAYIDGNHTYKGVMRDIEAYWPKVAPGGWLAGHDWEPKTPRKYGVVDAVTDWCKANGLTYELDEDASWWVRRTTEATAPFDDVGEYVKRIDHRAHFAQAGYGDGEWACLLGETGENCDGTTYHPDLAAALRKTLLENNGVWCATNAGNTELRYKAEGFIAEHGLAGLPWRKKETISNANVRGEMGPFLWAIKGRRTTVVGGPHLADRLFARDHIFDGGRGIREPRVPEDGVRLNIDSFVEVDACESWREATELVTTIRDVIDGRGTDLVLFAAGMGSNLMIHELWPHVKDRATLLDVGAIFDPYVGVLSRNGYRRPEFQEAMKRNLEGL